MRRRSIWAVAGAAVFAAIVTVSSPALSADLYDTPAGYDVGSVPSQDAFEGWWLGGTLGGASVSYDLAPASGSVSSNGVLGGIVGGYSWQSGPYVIGVEGDFLASDVSGSRHFNGGLNQVSPSINSMADLRLRAGYAVTPRLLLFGTFGGAWANVDLPISGAGGGIRETTFFGWSAGAGAEFALNPNWSTRIDYQFTNFESETLSYPGGNQTFDPDANSFRGSVIYRF